MNNIRLDEILKLHDDWLNERDGGVKANLRGADLRGADLGYADLRGANLGYADLRDVNLGYANLRYANLGYANLRGADLRYANLRGVNLGYANLRGADLRDANLRGADLRGANLRGAELDYSTWPLWCGSFDVKVDIKIAQQLLYHALAVDCDDAEFNKLREVCRGFCESFEHATSKNWETKESDNPPDAS